MKQILQRGFTLIELLVVIAIIGILAAVVLASLGDARESAQDSATQQTLQGLRSEAEISYNQNDFSYENACTDRLQATADEVDGECVDEEDTWVITAPLREGHWCVDSTGAAEVVDNAAAEGDTACSELVD